MDNPCFVGVALKANAYYKKIQRFMITPFWLRKRRPGPLLQVTVYGYPNPLLEGGGVRSSRSLARSTFYR